ncbi:hypothetical protein, partial [Mycolicibacterium goodii]|uniref:hypothetical protein n=1 Tax=Mycolicibacterium goodii TaxID=134601 RepID=UPI00256F4C0C
RIIWQTYHRTGDIQLARVRDTVTAVARRHTVRATTDAVSNDHVAHIHIRRCRRPDWTQYDLTDLSQRAQRLRLEVLAQREFCAPFELSRDAPLRITVVRTAADEADSVGMGGGWFMQIKKMDTEL